MASCSNELKEEPPAQKDRNVQARNLMRQKPLLKFIKTYCVLLFGSHTQYTEGTHHLAFNYLPALPALSESIHAKLIRQLFA